MRTEWVQLQPHSPMTPSPSDCPWIHQEHEAFSDSLLSRGARSSVQRSFILPCHRQWIGSMSLSHLAELVKDTVSIKVLPVPVSSQKWSHFPSASVLGHRSLLLFHSCVSSMGLFHNKHVDIWHMDNSSFRQPEKVCAHLSGMPVHTVHFLQHSPVQKH